MAELSYELNYAGIPFVEDSSKIVRLAQKQREGLCNPLLPPERHQPDPRFLDEIDRLIPFQYLIDFSPPKRRLGRNLNALALPISPEQYPCSEVKIGQFFYPTGASRWSVFRGLATSTMAKEMIRLTTGGLTAATFTMKAVPVRPGNITDSSYTITTSMYLMPPRCLGEHGGDMDGLYLITLVDERYKWQYEPSSLTISATTTWSNIIGNLATDLGISASHLYDAGVIEPVYLQPEIDSQFWCNRENAAILIDAAAANISRTFVRKLDGTYVLESNLNSLSLVKSNRGNVTSVVRLAGGDMLSSGAKLPITKLLSNTSLNDIKNAAIPASIDITFPKYVESDAPVPHMFNSRYTNQRPSCWYEDSYGDTYVINTPITSGETPIGSGLVVSGITGVGTHTIHSTAKALMSGSGAEAATTPSNVSGLIALSMQLAQDYYAQQVMAALDEVYPGTYAWTPEGFNDILWTYSADRRLASTRVMRGEWNQITREYQHATPDVGRSGCIVPRGVGGPSVAQTWRDAASGLPSTTLATPGITATDTTAPFTDGDLFPVQNRWMGVFESGGSNEEVVLFEGTSGGKSVGIYYRGIDGTRAVAHAAGASVIQRQPNFAYGVNLHSYEKMMWSFPGTWTSGGISEVVTVPQTQTVMCLASSGTLARGSPGINTIDHWSGRLDSYDASKQSGSQFPAQELVWIVERNGLPIRSGIRYDGQLVAIASLSGYISPVYAVNEYVFSGNPSILGSGVVGSGAIISGAVLKGAIGSGAVCSGKIASGSVNSGNISSGTVYYHSLSSGAVLSGHIGDAAVNSGNGASGVFGANIGFAFRPTSDPSISATTTQSIISFGGTIRDNGGFANGSGGTVPTGYSGGIYLITVNYNAVWQVQPNSFSASSDLFINDAIAATAIVRNGSGISNHSSYQISVIRQLKGGDVIGVAHTNDANQSMTIDSASGLFNFQLQRIDRAA